MTILYMFTEQLPCAKYRVHIQIQDKSDCQHSENQQHLESRRSKQTKTLQKILGISYTQSEFMDKNFLWYFLPFTFQHSTMAAQNFKETESQRNTGRLIQHTYLIPFMHSFIKLKFLKARTLCHFCTLLKHFHITEISSPSH